VSNAARMSSVFPGVGAVSVLATGWLSDRLGVNGRSLIMFVGLGLRSGLTRLDDNAIHFRTGRSCR